MKIFHTDGQVYYIDFMRDHRDDGATVTTCLIYQKMGFDTASNKPQLEKLSEGKSVCHPADRFFKDKGRRIALERALARKERLKSGFNVAEEALFKRDSRKEFFRQYDAYIQGSKDMQSPVERFFPK